MKLQRLLGIARFCVMIFISAVLVVGCGGKSDKDKDKDKDRVKGRDRAAKVAVFNARVRQLHETLSQLERDIDIQRTRIAAARGDLEAIQQSVASFPGGPLMVRDASLTATEQLASTDRLENHQVPDYEKDSTEKKAINRLLLILFLFALCIIVWWFWQSHRERRDEEFDQAWDIPPSDSSGTGESFVVPPAPHTTKLEPPRVAEPPADTDPEDKTENS